LLLRPWEESDASAFLSAYQDDEIRRWHTRRPSSEAQVREWFDAYRQDWKREKGGHWAITRGGGEVLGRIALRGLDFDDGIAGATYWVLPAARGAGVASHGLGALTAWALNEIGFQRLELDHSTRNHASCRVATKSGYLLEGTKRSAAVHDDRPCTDAVARTRELGLFAEPLVASPYAAEPEVTEAADDGFWASVRTELATRQGLLLEETHIVNATRWHRLTTENLNTVRAGLGPRALLTVWPDLQPDVGAVLTALPSEWHIEFVWETKDGTIRDVTVDETQYQDLAALVADARAARALSLYTDERSPLFQAVLPDNDGVLRARW
jgi:RimJ/RimL family protein N-acetyltransferase